VTCDLGLVSSDSGDVYRWCEIVAEFCGGVVNCGFPTLQYSEGLTHGDFTLSGWLEPSASILCRTALAIPNRPIIAEDSGGLNPLSDDNQPKAICLIVTNRWCMAVSLTLEIDQVDRALRNLLGLFGGDPALVVGRAPGVADRDFVGLFIIADY